MPLGVQLAVYRVVQEGLTNIARHAPGAAARVSVRDVGGCLEVEIENDRPLGAPASAVVSSESRGHGLVGLAERVALYGGEIRTQPRPDGTFLLAASVPLS